jgi:VWFA-related protein
MNRAVRIGAVAIMSFVVAIHVLGAARQDTPQPVPRFRTGVELVRLDVSVLDRDRRPVRGLGPADFTILEDGQPQNVAAFDTIDLPDVAEARSAEAPWAREVAPDVRSNADFRNRRVVVIVVDDATPVATQEVLFYPRLARQIIDALGPDDLAAVVFPMDQGAGQDFTSDRVRLLAAIGRFNPPIPLPTMTKDGTVKNAAFDRLDGSLTVNYGLTVGTLRKVAEFLGDLPERRKALVFVSVGIPLDIGAAGPVESPAGGADTGGVAKQLMTDVSECLRAAQRANVAIYAFDPGGLRAPYGGAPSDDPANPGRPNRWFLKTLSENTGGFAVVDTNDAAPGVAQLVRETGSYYLLGYVPIRPGAQGRFRRIDVHVNRRDVTVRTRTGYYEPRPEKRAGTAPARPSALAEAAAGVIPKSDLALQATAAAFPIPGRREATIALAIGVHPYAPARATRAVLQVELVAAAYSPDGKRRASRRETVPATLNFPGAGGLVGFDLLTRLDLAPGRYQLRLAAESTVRGVKAAPLAPAVAFIRPDEDTAPRSGSVYCDLDVPDFLREPLALSGVVISVSPPVASGPPRALASLLPVVPTTMREFYRDQGVGGFVRVSQGANQALRPVTIRLRITDRHGTAVQQKADTLGAAMFGATRTADYPFDVPVSSLAPGPHLLTIEAAADGRTVRRDVRFAVLR